MVLLCAIGAVLVCLGLGCWHVITGATATSPDGSSRSWESQVIEAFQRGYHLLVERSDVLDVEKERADMDAVAGIFKSVGPIDWSPVSADGTPAEWVVPSGITPERTALFIHGGAFIVESLEGARAAAGNIAVAGKARVLSIDYRLAPEHPFPAALEDVLAAYRWLLATGVKPESIVVIGESAGGTLALGVLLQLRDQRMPLPGLAVCLSPLTDLAMSGDSWELNAERDLLLHPERVRRSIGLYLAGADLGTPLASPFYAELGGLPPMLIQVGSEEYLLSDATWFADKATAAGVPVKLEVWDHMQHGWHIMAPFLLEASAALAGVGEFMGGIPSRDWDAMPAARQLAEALDDPQDLRPTRRAAVGCHAPGPQVCATIRGSLPASAGQLSSRPLGGL